MNSLYAGTLTGAIVIGPFVGPIMIGQHLPCRNLSGRVSRSEPYNRFGCFSPSTYCFPQCALAFTTKERTAR